MFVKVIATKCYRTFFVSFSKHTTISAPKCSTSVLNTLVLILSPPTSIIKCFMVMTFEKTVTNKKNYFTALVILKLLSQCQTEI